MRARVCACVSGTVDLKDSAVANKIRQPVSDNKKKRGLTFFWERRRKPEQSEEWGRPPSQKESSHLLVPHFHARLFLNPGEVVRLIEAGVEGVSCFLYMRTKELLLDYIIVFYAWKSCLLRCFLSGSGSVDQNKLSAQKHFSVKVDTEVGLNPGEAKNTRSTIEKSSEWNPTEVFFWGGKKNNDLTTIDPDSDVLTSHQLELGATVWLLLVLKRAKKEKHIDSLSCARSSCQLEGDGAPLLLMIHDRDFTMKFINSNKTILILLKKLYILVSVFPSEQDDYVVNWEKYFSPLPFNISEVSHTCFIHYWSTATSLTTRSLFRSRFHK